MQSRAVIFVEMGKPLLVENVEFDDEPPPGHALVRNFASGVCHSQLHALHGHTNPALPTVLGHESTGEVVSVGEGVTHVKAGDKVRHTTFGDGIVVSCDPSGADFEVTVAFKDGQGVKRLLLSFAPLERVE